MGITDKAKATVCCLRGYPRDVALRISKTYCKINMPEIVDDKSEHCIPFILEMLKDKRLRSGKMPLFVGINGAQGSGKTTLVRIARHRV